MGTYIILRIDDVTMMSDQVLRSQILYRGLHIQHIYHHAKFECSSFSSVANTRGGALVLQGTKKPGWNRVKLTFPILD